MPVSPRPRPHPAGACLRLLCAGLLAAALGAPGGAAAATPPAHVVAAVAAPDRWERDRTRDTRDHPATILAFSGVQPGQQVLDLYSGGGYWAELFARAVAPGGSVVAHTNTAYRNFAGRLLDARFAPGRVPNATVHDAEIADLALGRQRFDLVFIGLGYHDIYFHADFSPLVGRDWLLGQLWDALKPGGTLVVVDHAARDGSGAKAVQALHRIEEAFARADIESAGFVFEADSDVLRNPADERRLNVFDDAIRHHTDRFVLRFLKPR
ncbi:MAG: methyltransferase type 11 [Gammaproteobacteria bacterium]